MLHATSLALRIYNTNNPIEKLARKKNGGQIKIVGHGRNAIQDHK